MVKYQVIDVGLLLILLLLEEFDIPTLTSSATSEPQKTNAFWGHLDPKGLPKREAKPCYEYNTLVD